MVGGPSQSLQGTKLTHIASATSGKFAWGTPFGGQRPRNRRRSLDSVEKHPAENFQCLR